MSAHAALVTAQMAIQWGFLQLSWGNLILLLTMAVAFVAALLLPFPEADDEQ